MVEFYAIFDGSSNKYHIVNNSSLRFKVEAGGTIETVTLQFAERDIDIETLLSYSTVDIYIDTFKLWLGKIVYSSGYEKNGVVSVVCSGKGAELLQVEIPEEDGYVLVYPQIVKAFHNNSINVNERYILPRTTANTNPNSDAKDNVSVLFSYKYDEHVGYNDYVDAIYYKKSLDEQYVFVATKKNIIRIGFFNVPGYSFYKVKPEVIATTDKEFGRFIRAVDDSGNKFYTIDKDYLWVEVLTDDKSGGYPNPFNNYVDKLKGIKFPLNEESDANARKEIDVNWSSSGDGTTAYDFIPLKTWNGSQSGYVRPSSIIAWYSNLEGWRFYCSFAFVPSGRWEIDIARFSYRSFPDGDVLSLQSKRGWAETYLVFFPAVIQGFLLINVGGVWYEVEALHLENEYTCTMINPPTINTKYPPVVKAMEIEDWEGYTKHYVLMNPGDVQYKFWRSSIHEWSFEQTDVHLDRYSGGVYLENGQKFYITANGSVELKYSNGTWLYRQASETSLLQLLVDYSMVLGLNFRYNRSTGHFELLNKWQHGEEHTIDVNKIISTRTVYKPFFDDFKDNIILGNEAREISTGVTGIKYKVLRPCFGTLETFLDNMKYWYMSKRKQYKMELSGLYYWQILDKIIYGSESYILKSVEYNFVNKITTVELVGLDTWI